MGTPVLIFSVPVCVVFFLGLRSVTYFPWCRPFGDQDQESISGMYDAIIMHVHLHSKTVLYHGCIIQKYTDLHINLIMTHMGIS